MMPILQRKSICAVIVTHKPDALIAARITKIAGQVDRVVVIDNDSGPATRLRLQVLEIQPSIHLLLNNQNLGIATALNQGAQWAFERGYAYLLLFDQDTSVLENFVDVYAKISSEISLEETIVGTNFLQSVDGKAGQKIKPEFIPAGSSGNWAKAITVATSGTLLPREAWEKIGPFRDEFFIDCVDEEYCLRARRQGVRIVISTAPLMQHSVGEQTYYRFLWMHGLTYNYSPLRHYCRLRNSVVVWRTFCRQEPRWVVSHVLFNVRILAKICFCEPQKSRKLSALALGLLDGLCSRFDLMAERVHQNTNPSKYE